MAAALLLCLFNMSSLDQKMADEGKQVSGPGETAALFSRWLTHTWSAIRVKIFSRLFYNTSVIVYKR